jgi:hypothetical protein
VPVHLPELTHARVAGAKGESASAIEVAVRPEPQGLGVGFKGLLEGVDQRSPDALSPM